MPYIGNPAVVGDSANTFRLLDDITSFTVTFDATDSDVVSISGDTLTFSNHRFVTGQKVTYNDGGGTAIGGLSDGSYFIIKVCLLYTSPSPRDRTRSRMPSSA